MKEVVLTVKVIAEIPDDVKAENLAINLDMKRVTISEVGPHMDRDIESKVLAYVTEKSAVNK